MSDEDKIAKNAKGRVYVYTIPTTLSNILDFLISWHAGSYITSL